MKSKVTIDFAEDSMRPVIKLRQSWSDDVRDKLTASFLQGQGSNTDLCSILNTRNSSSDNDAYCNYEISPINDVYEAIITQLCKLHPDEKISIVSFINELGNRELEFYGE